MKNRAKCKLCLSVIESYHSTDYVSCKCGEIEVYGGQGMNCASKDWNNFLRVDDEGNEVIVKVKDESKLMQEGKIEEEGKDGPSAKPTRKELMDMLDDMINNIENMPPHAMSTSINHYDLCAVLMLFKLICNSSIV